ncbi:MAG: hypothetical protein IJV66_06440, partial [Firmicutes bacterium]|nr:hypothetical protein [Bacillota bacterium]
MSAVVVFVTTYMLILPALTLDKEEAKDQGGVDVPSVTQQAEEQNGGSEEALASEDPYKTSDVRDVENGVGGSQAASEDLLTFTDKEGSYVVSCDADSKAKLPADTALSVYEIDKSNKQDKEEYNFYREETLNALRDELGEEAAGLQFVKFYDIALMSGNKEVEPASPVKITINYDKKNEVSPDGNAVIVHFSDQGGKIKAELLDEDDFDFEINDNSIEKVIFKADSFSVYSVVYTEAAVKGESVSDADSESTAVSDADETADIASDSDESKDETSVAEDRAYFSGTLHKSTSGYTVAVKVPEKAKLPEGTELNVTRIGKKNGDYTNYRNEAVAAINDNLGEENVSGFQFADFFDISFTKDGKEIEPESSVNVSITYSDKPDIDRDGQPQIVHLTKDSKGAVKSDVLSSKDGTFEIKKDKLQEINFKADSFSVYAVFYTVDFSYSVNGKMYDFSLPGGGFVSFTNLIEVLGIIEGTNSGENDI